MRGPLHTVHAGLMRRQLAHGSLRHPDGHEGIGDVQKRVRGGGWGEGAGARRQQKLRGIRRSKQAEWRVGKQPERGCMVCVSVNLPEPVLDEETQSNRTLLAQFWPNKEVRVCTLGGGGGHGPTFVPPVSPMVFSSHSLPTPPHTHPRRTMLSTSRCSENPPITDAEKALPTQRDVDPFLIAVTSDASGTVVALSEAAADAMLADTNPDFITTAVSHPDGVCVDPSFL